MTSHRFTLGVLVGIWSFALPTVGAQASEATVEGALRANGETVEMPFVYIFEQEEGFYDPSDPTWTLLFVEREIPVRDLEDHIWDQAYVRLGITRTAEFAEEGDEAEMQILSQDIRFSADAGGNISGGADPELDLTEAGPERFAGRVFLAEEQEFFDDRYQYDFRFTVSLSDPSAPWGDPLPAGGGEPGKAYLEQVEAIRSGDPDRIKALIPPEQAAMLESGDMEEIEDNMAFLQMMTPNDIEIVGGSSDGEIAILEVTGNMGGAVVNGEITVLNEDGRWIATESEWR